MSDDSFFKRLFFFLELGFMLLAWVRACRLLTYVAKSHKMGKLLITNGHKNEASKRVCEKLGAKWVRMARLPEWHDLYEEGLRFVNIFEWSID